MYLSVIIPAYNEERRLPKTLEEIDKYLRKQTYLSTGSGQADYEIIVVNDGSKDKTAQVVENLKLKIANLKLIDNKENQGKGYSVRQGMRAARGRFRLFTDADNSTSIDQVEKMWLYFEDSNPPKDGASRYAGGPRVPTALPAEGGAPGYDIVIGSRDVRGAILDPPQNWFRIFVGEGFKLLRKIIVGLWEIEDTQCGFKGFTKKAVEDVFPKCKINRFAFDPEILISAKKLGYKIKEIPVYWRNDPESKVKFKSMIKMAIDLLKIRWNLITKKYG